MRPFPPDPKSDKPVDPASSQSSSHDSPDDREALRQDLARRGIGQGWLAGPADTDIVTSDEIVAAFAALRSEVLEQSPQASQLEAEPGAKPPSELESLNKKRSQASNRFGHFDKHVRFRRGAGVGGIVGLGAALALLISVITRPTRSGPSQVYETKTGERASFTLSDGSRITLAPRSRLSVPIDFGRGARLVDLTGEAAFDVTHRTDHPFTVQTQSVMTRVLGTSFDVRHYDGDADVRVVVASGKVALQGSRRVDVQLAAGMLARATDSTVKTESVNPSPYTSWTSGRLDFQGTTVREVLATLTRWYGVRFQLADTTLASQRVTTSLDYSATRDVIAALETLLNVSAVSAPGADGSVIVLRPRAHEVHAAPIRREIPSAFSPETREVGR